MAHDGCRYENVFKRAFGMILPFQSLTASTLRTTLELSPHVSCYSGSNVRR